VQFANVPANAGTTISLPANTYTLNINGSGGCILENTATGNTIGDLEINQSTTITGAGAATTIVRQLAVFAALVALVALALPGVVGAADTRAVEGKVIAGHGTLLVATSNKMTLYTFDKDVAGSGVSNCTGGCLAAWPALTVPAGATATGGAGVTGALGTITRADDGTLQVTYDGLPLYFFAKDTAPGDTNGIYTNWRAITLAAETPPQTSTAPVSDGSSSSGTPLPLLLVAGIGALGFLVVLRRLAAARV